MTLLAGAMALGLVAVQLVWAAQFNRAKNDPTNQENQAIQANPLSLSVLDDRATTLEPITNWIEREKHCIGLAYLGRELDAALDPGARVFVSGMLGTTNLPKAGYYYFMKNYLFPRDVEISLDGKAFSDAHGFHGVPCDSPDVLRSNGFDVMIEFTDYGPRVIPLTPKGQQRSE